MDFKKLETNALFEQRDAFVKELESEEITEERIGEIRTLLEGIKTEIEERKAQAKREEEEREMISSGEIKTNTIEEKKEERKMDLLEIRSSQAYADAFVKYIKTGKDAEVRAQLSDNAASGTIPVPVMVESVIKNAWENDKLFALIKKSYAKGNLKVGFEISSDGAKIHTEGGDAITEENLVMGIVKLVPETIKKYVAISDEALDSDSNGFLEYVYKEIAHYIAKKVVDELLRKIIACDTASTTTCVGVPVVESTQITQGLIVDALCELSDQASAPVVVMNKQTYKAFNDARLDHSFDADIFAGCEVMFNNSLPAFSVASTGDCYAIVGDFGFGAQANFPNGTGIEMKYDDLTLATQDLVRVIGRMPVAVEPVAPMAFCKITK